MNCHALPHLTSPTSVPEGNPQSPNFIGKYRLLGDVPKVTQQLEAAGQGLRLTGLTTPLGLAVLLQSPHHTAQHGGTCTRQV